MSGSRRLLARLRDAMARGAASLPALARLVSDELVSEVCSIYAMRPGDLLELTATVGLRPEAVGHTRLRVGEGIVGLCAATGETLNLADVQNHPRFAYRSETGEDAFSSMLAVPIRRAGHTLGVVAVQNEAPRRYADDEVDVLQTVAMLLAELLARAGTGDGAEQGLSATLPRQFNGNRLAAGIAIGPVVLRGRSIAPIRLLARDPAAELRRLAEASETMQRGVDALLAEQTPEGDAPREVLEAYRMLATDRGWLRRVADAVRGGLTAEAAVHRVAGDLRERMRKVSDPYLRERLADMEDAVDRLLATLDADHAGNNAPEDAVAGGVLLTRRLGPAQLLDWHARGIAGVVIEEGSPAGHAAIVARALGIPALGGARGAIEAVETGDEVVLDADGGLLVLRPEQEVRQAYRRAREARDARQAAFAALRDVPARTADGTRVQLMLNIGLALELDQLDRVGADGIGLFRTEIGALARGSVADVHEQAALYARVLDEAAGRPVLFRTLDLGGDKLLPDAPAEEAENPAMGWRSLRVQLDRPQLLRRQLRALLLAAGGRPLSVMFPMVATVAEFVSARALLEAEATRVRPAPRELRIGAMLEVPALLWQLDALLTVADFVSVGSNDLMQFLFAADRAAPRLAERYDLLSAPMLDALDQLARAGVAAGTPVSLCGEAASRPLEALALVALGITSLSMPATLLPPIKAMLASVDLRQFRPVLDTIRRGGRTERSLREPIEAWAREAGLAL